MEVNNNYDVAILGSGIGGSMLGSILAKNGLSVLLIDSGSHPRFAIGEATTPDTSFRLKLLAAKYNLPEIDYLSTFYKLRDNVSPACGIKRAFSFVYQRDGVDQNPKESHQYPTLAPPMGPDCHFFRQDTDAYMLSVAAQYGADVRQQTMIENIEFTEENATLTSDKGKQFTVKYVVDGAGFRSPLAKKFDLRKDTSEMKTNSRAIFTHMVNVKLYDQIGKDIKDYEMKYPISQSTLHHVFEGGWFWVIPFNNHEEAVNPLCSVGLMLNRDIHPETGMDAEEEFFLFVNRFPEMAKQFEKAKSVRNWVSTGRVQYSSKNIVGHRYCLLAHAAGFIDPLFSSGLNLTAATTDLYAKQIMEAFETNDFSVEKFQHINDKFQENLSLYDDVVSNSFISFQNYELWDAWYRVWVVALLVGTSMNANQYMKYLQTKKRSVLSYSEKDPYTGLLGSKFTECREMYDKASEMVHMVNEGKMEAKEAASQIRMLFKGINYCPSYWKWDDAKVRSTPAFTIWSMTRMYFWYRFNAPKHVRKLMYDWSPVTAYLYIFKSILTNNKLSRKRKKKFNRDVFKAWNTDWSAKSAQLKSA